MYQIMKNLSSITNEISPTCPSITEEDQTLDLTLRPRSWSEFVGQDRIKKNLQIIIEAARKRGQNFCEHILFYGNSGLGKTSLSNLIARELKTNLRTITGPAIRKTGDLAAVLTNINEGDVLFCDECHGMNKMIEEFLYPALEDFHLNLILGQGPMARTMEIKLPRFTFIGATTRLALISSPLRNRFGATFQLNFYQQQDIEKIINRSSELLGITITPEATEIIAKCSRFTPRVANRLLKRARDFAQVENEKIITADTAKKTLSHLEIDELGLESGDRKILEAIIKKFDGGPVGLQALSAATSEEIETILDIYEPYLMQLGFVERTPRGRTATKIAYQHIGLKYKGGQNSLI